MSISTRRQNDHARELRRQQTEAERHLWRSLRSSQLADAKFRRQVPVGPYIVDFLCLGANLIIELDGGQHSEPLHERRDLTRDAYLSERGYRVLRFWNHEVLMDLGAVLEQIRIEVMKSDGTPSP